MKRFQRGKYLRQVVELRRELSGWIAGYRTMGMPENHYQYTARQLTVAEDRSIWLEDVVDKLEEIEDMLADGAEEC